MEKLSGLVLDIYDDPMGEVLRTVFPTQENLPDIVKEAHAIDQDTRDKLPDEAFALVLVDGPVELKKYATIDRGNTALSVEYFLKTAHKLPEEAQKVAAQNLVAACELYDIEPPEGLRKVAFDAQKLVPTDAEIKKAKKRDAELATDSINTGLTGALVGSALGGRSDWKKGALIGGATGVVLTKILNPMANYLEDYLEKKAIGLLPLAMGALTIPASVSEAKKNLKAVKPAGGRVMTPQQVQTRRAQLRTT